MIERVNIMLCYFGVWCGDNGRYDHNGDDNNNTNDDDNHDYDDGDYDDNNDINLLNYYYE